MTQRVSHFLPFATGFLISILFASLVGLAHLSHVPNYDEFYHLVPAISWNQDGTLSLLDGTYDRASSFTILVAQSIKLFGVSFEAARIPALVPGILLVGAVFIWVYRHTHSLAAFLSATLLGMMPIFAYTASQSRFYALHAFLIFLGSVFVYVLGTATIRKNLSALSMGGAAFALIILVYAMTLQPSTLIAVLGLGLWLVFINRHFFMSLSLPIKIAGGIALVLLLVFGHFSGLLDKVLGLFTDNPLWSEKDVGRPHFYLMALGSELGYLWSLLPLIILMGYRQKNKEVLIFSGIVFATVFCVHSLAAQKSERYILYGLPFLAVLTGVSLGEIIRSMFQKVLDLINSVGGARVSAPLSKVFAFSSIAVFCCLGVVLDPTLRENVKNAVAPNDITALSNWDLIMPTIAPLVSQRTVVTTEGIKAAYYLKDYHFELNRSVAFEIDDEEDFRVDPRTGRRAIGTLAEMQQIFSCQPRGLIIADKKRWRASHGVAPDIADYIEQIGMPVSIPSKSHLLIYTWDNPESNAQGCNLN